MTDQESHVRFKNTQDWYNFINSPDGKKISARDLHQIRLECYTQIEKIRRKPLIVYAAQIVGVKESNSIDLNDVAGFTDLVNSIDKSKKQIDVLIHSPGGSPEATERIVYILRNRFDEVNFLIPHSAYSAATMLALSGNEIILHPSASLGPIDPQLDGIPAKSIRNGFEKVKKILKKEGPESIPAYLPLIKQYSLHLLELCEDFEVLSKTLAKDWLKNYMFSDTKGKKLQRIINYFSDYGKHLTHSRPLVYNKIKDMGLKISLADGLLKDLLWECFILYNGFFGISDFVKLFESNYGVSYGRQIINKLPLAPMPAPPISQ